MPESPTNTELGMFLVKISCYSHEGQTVDASMRTVCSHKYTNSHLNLPIACVPLPLENAPLTKNIFHRAINFVLNLDNATLSLLPAADSGDSDVASFDADRSN